MSNPPSSLIIHYLPSRVGIPGWHPGTGSGEIARSAGLNYF
jgi:hypothetical protein